MDDPAVGPDGPTQLVAVPKALVSGAPLYARVSQEKFEDVAYWVGYSEAAEAFALHEPSAHADSDRAQTGLCTALTEPPVECAQPTLGFAKELLDAMYVRLFTESATTKMQAPDDSLFSESANTVLHSWTPALDAMYVRLFTESATTQVQAPDKAFSQNRRRQMSRPRTTAFSQNWRRHGSRPLMAAFSLNRRRPRPRPRSFARH